LVLEVLLLLMLRMLLLLLRLVRLWLNIVLAGLTWLLSIRSISTLRSYSLLMLCKLSVVCSPCCCMFCLLLGSQVIVGICLTWLLRSVA
jgi:hypothetical protein